MSKPAILSCGEVLWDLFPDGPRFGGAPANFACHAAILGGAVAKRYGLPAADVARWNDVGVQARFKAGTAIVVMVPNQKKKTRVATGGGSSVVRKPIDLAELFAALSDAGVDHQVETYPARHGWVPRDTAAHDSAEAEHHWRTLVPFLAGALQRSH